MYVLPRVCLHSTRRPAIALILDPRDKWSLRSSKHSLIYNLSLEHRLPPSGPDLSHPSSTLRVSFRLFYREDILSAGSNPDRRNLLKVWEVLHPCASPWIRAEAGQLMGGGGRTTGDPRRFLLTSGSDCGKRSLIAKENQLALWGTAEDGAANVNRDIGCVSLASPPRIPNIWDRSLLRVSLSRGAAWGVLYIHPHHHPPGCQA